MQLTAPLITQIGPMPANVPVVILNGASIKVFAIEFQQINLSSTGVINWTVTTADGTTTLMNISLKTSTAHGDQKGGNFSVKVPFLADRGLAISCDNGNGFQFVTVFSS